MNPYKILGLRPNASAEDIKSAYQKIINDYDYNTTEDLENKFFIEDKIAEANDAYNSLMNNLRYKNIRKLIESDEITIAETELNLISDKNNAEWNYLRGFVMIRKGSYGAGIAHLRKANELNPTNPEYKQTISILNQKLEVIKANYDTARASSNPAQPSAGGGGGDMCGSPNSGGNMGMPNMGGGMPNMGGMPNLGNMAGLGGMPNMGGGMPNMGGGNNNLQNQMLQNMLMNGGGNMCGNAGGGGGGGGMC